MKVLCALLGLCAGAFLRFGTADGALLYDAYVGPVHLIISDNATPGYVLDDWMVDWEYR